MIRATSLVMATVFGPFAPSDVLAQHGPGRHEPSSAEQRQNPGAERTPAYDLDNETTFKGTVVGMKTGRSAWRWFARIHTLGLGHTAAEREKQILLRTAIETVQVHLGPTPFIEHKGLDITKGDELELTGSRVTPGESQLVLARKVRKDARTWTLRDATGHPLWSPPQVEPRGFWTRTRVLLAVAAAKAVALATVLRH